MKPTFLISAALVALVSMTSLSFSAAADEKPKKEKKAKGKAVAIFDGKTLNGWKHDEIGKATYVVEDGVIVGTTVEGSSNSFLLSEKQYGDFELQFDVKVDTGLNSGVQIRSLVRQEDTETKGGNGKMRKSPKGRVYGPQVELESSPGQAAYIYGEDTGLGWLSKEPLDKAHAHEHMKNDDWNSIRIVARGPRISTWINGEKVTTLNHEEIYATHAKGHIGLQVHGIKAGTGPFQVRWRNLKLKELPEGGAKKKE